MCFPSWYCKCRWKCDDLSILTFESQAYLWETELSNLNIRIESLRIESLHQNILIARRGPQRYSQVE
jgi:hypothetical protein